MRHILPLLLAAAMAAPASGQAQTRIIAQANGWTAVDGTAEGGTAVCALETRDPNTGRRFLLQQLAGQERPLLRLSRPNWSLRGTAQPVRIVIDNRQTFADSAAVSGQELIWPLALSGFEPAFRQGRYMRVEFPAGQDASWNLSLTGTNNVMGAFMGCLRMLTVQPGPGTAPPPLIQPTPPSEPPPLGPQPGEPLQPPPPAGPPRAQPPYLGLPPDKPAPAPAPGPTAPGGKPPAGKPGGAPVPL